MIALALLLGGGLYLGHRQAQKRALATGEKAPENALAPTSPLISDDNTGMPAPVKAETSRAAVPVENAAANPAVAATPLTFMGEEAKLYFEEARAEPAYVDNVWGPSKRAESESVREKTAEREAVRKVTP